MADRKGLILITGPPGVGKTTLIRKICQDLVNKHQVKCNGFYTEEVRDPTGSKRIGFDVVTLNNKRGILSRESPNQKGPYVGKYCVYVKDFENIALPVVNPFGQDLLVIDEVGKMELNIPCDPRQTLHLVDRLKAHPNAQIIVVSKENRNILQGEVIKIILNFLNV